MNINLAKEFYPIRYIELIEGELSEALSLRVIDETASAYTLELQPKEKDSDLGALTGKFLNRFLERAIIEKLG